MLNCSLHASWDNFLSLLPANNYDIYFTEAYLNLNKNRRIPECFICQENKSIWLFPYIKKQIIYENTIYWDFESQYGYGGPVSNCDDYTFLQQAQIEFCNFMKNEGFIAGLVKFHPLLNNHKLLKDCTSLFFNRHTIGIDLTQDIETILQKHIHHRKRAQIRKGEKMGLKYLIDVQFKYYDEFKEIYIETMKKNHADEFYFFNDEYFGKIRKEFVGSSFLCHVLFKGKIINSAIILYSNNFAHYHLIGTKIDFVSLNANSFLIFKTIQYLKSLNKKIFHLGGGSDSSEDNSLYRFKALFSKQCYDFYIGEIVFNQSIYGAICKDWAEANPEKAITNHNKLLKYRF